MSAFCVRGAGEAGKSLVRRLVGGVFLFGLLNILVAGSAWAADAEFPAPPLDSLPRENNGKDRVRKIGTIRQEKSRLDWNRWWGDRILVLVCPEESFTLLRGRDKRVVARLEQYIGKRVEVTGELVPPQSRHPRSGLKVYEFSEQPAASGPLDLTKDDLKTILDF